MALAAVSCVFALGVNISNYLVLGKTSPLTYQVRHTGAPHLLFLFCAIASLKFPLEGASYQRPCLADGCEKMQPDCSVLTTFLTCNYPRLAAARRCWAI
jgi:hypothetical protein